MSSRYRRKATLTGIRHRFNRNRSQYRRAFVNRSPYKPRITFYETPLLDHPTKQQRAAISKTPHIWKETDSYWKLASFYYEDPAYWWIIAMYNQAPTESHLQPGEQIYIPTNLSEALQLLNG